MSGKESAHFGYQLPKITWIVKLSCNMLKFMLIFLVFFFLINEHKTKKNFVTQSINLNFCKIIFSSYLTQWHSTLIKVTCPMNVHKFQCCHRSLLFHDRIGFEKAALEDEYFSTQETHLPSSDL